MSYVSFRGKFLLKLGMFGTLACGTLFAQNGAIQGTIADAQGAVIPNASVKAIDEAKAVVVREVTTAANGSFQLQPLPPGTYTVNAESTGMKRMERTGVVLNVNQILNLGEVRLEIGATTDAITVLEERPVIETTTSNKSFVINSKQVTELSLNGRDFQSLIRTLPGVVSNDASDFRLAFNNTDAFHVNGMRGSANNVYLDGSINTDVGANDGQYTQLSMDAVGEFKVQNSTFAAEYGRNPGVLLSATTKSGGQQFHGTAYEFLRNDALDANSFFNNLQGQDKSKLRYNQFGGNLGGPLYIPKLSTPSNKKLFFFFNYEGTRASRPTGNNFYDVPHPDLLNGDFSRLLRSNPDGSPQLIAGTNFQVGTIFRPGTLQRNSAGNVIGGVPYPNNVIPQSEWSANAGAFQNLLSSAYRGGTFSAVPNAPELVRVPFQDTYTFHKDQKALRIDYAISSKANAFFRWVDDAQQESQNFGIFSGNTFPVLPEYRKKPGSSWSWNLINVISPTTTNEFIFTYNHLTQVVDVPGNVDPSTYDRGSLGFTFQELFPNSNLRNKFPKFSADANSQTGFDVSPFPPGWRSEGKTFAWTDNFTKIFGAHTFKTGVFFNMNLNGQQPSWTDSPQFDFNPNLQNLSDSNNGFANMLLGNYTSLQQSNGVFYGSFRFFQLEAFAQDSWKVNRKLTLEYGLRWAYIPPTYTYGDFLQNYWDPSRYNPANAVSINTTPGLTQGSIIPNSGDPFNGIVEEGNGIPSGFLKHRKNNWAPRFGFAYDPRGDGRTAIRGGFGIFYERIRQNINNFDGLGNPPLSFTPNLFTGNIDNVSPALIESGTRFPVNINAMNPDGQIPTTYSWSFGVQQQLPWGVALDVSYVGNQSAHLQYQIPLNQLPVGTTVNTSILQDANNTTNAIRPFLGFGDINYTDYGANANYHALQVRASRRFTNNLMVNLSYAWSKSMDIVDNDGGSDSNNPAADGAIDDKFNRQREYGLAGWDRQHVLTIDYVYTLPQLRDRGAFMKYALGGWQVSGITTFASGFPLTVYSANGNTGTLGGGMRADYVGGQISPDEKTWQEWFNPLAFGRPADGTLGNTGKGIIRSPGINSWNISLFKNFNFTENIRAQLRLETFNTFNHTQFNGVNTRISMPNPGQALDQANRGTSGQINSTRDPRTIQLGAKFYF